MAKRYPKGKGWYHMSGSASFGGIVYHEESPTTATDGNWWGPFSTYGEAKADAIDFQRSDIDSARAVIAQIRAHRKGT